MPLADDRIFGLDLLRCVAIILVLLTHTVILINPQGLYKIPVYTGYLGVEFFFVLSGFLIGSILWKVHSKATPLGFKDVKVFWIRRWFRTLPNYYLMFLVYAVLASFAHHINIFSHFKYLSYLVFLQNAFSYQPNNFYQVAWSLSIEEWFYLLFPLLLLLAIKVFNKNKRLPFLITTLAVIFIALCTRTYTAVFLDHTWDEGFRKLMPLRLDTIGFGILAAYIKFNKPLFWNDNSKILACLGLGMLTLLLVYFSLYYVRYFDPITGDHALRQNVFLDTLFFTLTSFAIALTIPFLCGIKIKEGYFSRSVTFISEISYSIYLSHLFILLGLSYVFKYYVNISYSNFILFVSAWVLIIPWSAIQYRFFEVKMTSLRDRFTKTQAAIKI